jgi:ribonuclease P/MRP protein subunit RPP40
VSDKLLSWFESFLSNRTQRVQVSSTLSESVNVLSGVPQGSVIGPILFLLHVNDIPDLFEGVTCKLFADDLKLYKKFQRGTEPVDLKNAVSLLTDWSIKWQLPIAGEKCAVLSLGAGNKQEDYAVENIILPHPVSIRDLGIIITPNLKSTVHCSLIAKDAMIRCARIFRTFKTADRDVLLRLYTTFVRPMLEYATPVFSPYQVGDIKKIESVQKYFTRQIFKRSFPERSRTAYANRLLLLGIPSLEMRRVRADLVMCYKIVHKEVDVNRDAFFRIKVRGNNGRALSIDVPPAKYSLDCQRYSFAHRTYPI